VTDGRLTGIRELAIPREVRVVVGRLTAEGRTAVGRLGRTVRVDRGCDALRRVVTGCRVVAERVAPLGRLILLRDVGRRLLALSARVNVGLQIIATARVNVSKCLFDRIMVLLLLGSSEIRLFAIASLQPCKR